MSDNEEINSQWDVDHIKYRLGYYTPFDGAMVNLGRYSLAIPETQALIEAMLELVHEIERLQTALINMGEQVVATGAITPYEYGDDYWAEHNVMEYWAKPDDQDALWREGWRPI